MPLQAPAKARILLVGDGQRSRRITVNMPIMPRATKNKGSLIHAIRRRLEKVVFRFLLRILPSNRLDAMKVKRKSLRFFLENGHLLRRYNTKWLEAITLQRAIGAAVANFIRNNVNYRF